MNDYEKQAQDFLTETGTTLTVEYQYTAPYWQDDKEKRDIYRFTLKKRTRGEYSANFGDSLRNTAINRICKNRFSVSIEDTKMAGIYSKMSWGVEQAAKKLKPVKPGAYDILACLGSYYPETFEDFCAEFGYADLPLSDYPKIMGIFHACKNEERGLKKIFTTDQLEKLAEIN